MNKVRKAGNHKGFDHYGRNKPWKARNHKGFVNSGIRQGWKTWNLQWLASFYLIRINDTLLVFQLFLFIVLPTCTKPQWFPPFQALFLPKCTKPWWFPAFPNLCISELTKPSWFPTFQVFVLQKRTRPWRFPVFLAFWINSEYYGGTATSTHDQSGGSSSIVPQIHSEKSKSWESQGFLHCWGKSWESLEPPGFC